MFWKILQIHRKTRVSESLFNKVRDLQPRVLLKRNSDTGVSLHYEFCKIFQSTFSEEHVWRLLSYWVYNVNCYLFDWLNTSYQSEILNSFFYSIPFLFSCFFFHVSGGLLEIYTAWKVSKYEVFSGPSFPVLGLNTEIYCVNRRIQSEYRIIRTRKKSVLDTFHAVIWLGKLTFITI